MAESRNAKETKPAAGKDAPAAPARQEAAPPKPTDHKKFMIIAIAVGVLILAALGVVGVLLLQNLKAPPGSAAQEPPTIVQPVDGPMLQLDEMIVNVGGAASGHYARVQIALEFYDEYGYNYFMGIDPTRKGGGGHGGEEGKLVPNVIRAHDVILSVLSGSQVSDFDDVPGMKQKLLEAVNGVLYQPVVKDVHFIERAVQ